jgi:hypothetical protein
VFQKAQCLSATLCTEVCPPGYSQGLS